MERANSLARPPLAPSMIPAVRPGPPQGNVEHTEGAEEAENLTSGAVALQLRPRRILPKEAVSHLLPPPNTFLTSLGISTFC